MDTPPSSSSTTSESFGISSTVDELSFGTIVKKDDETDSGNDPIDPFTIKGGDFEVISKDMDVTDSGRVRVDPFHTVLSGEKATTFTDDGGEEPASKGWSLLGSLTRLVIRSVEFQVSLMISLIRFPPWLVYSCLAFVFEPYRTMRRGRRYLLARIVEFCDLGLEEDHKVVVELVRRLAWGFIWAVYVGIVLFALLAFAFMISGFVITHLAHEPLVIKESLNFDYTKNSPEAYVPITSCDSSCKESIETGKFRIIGLKVNPSNHRTDITVSMTLPESEYNRNLGMFQVRVDYLSASGEILASLRRPCMVRFRSEPIRLVQTLLKIAPLVTGCLSEIQTLNLKLKGFVENDMILTACLKIMIEQRAEFRTGAGIPEIYDASLFVESKLPLFKRIIWNWRRTLFVWIGMSVFITELLFALVFFRPLIISIAGQRRQQRDRRTSSINNTSNLDGQVRLK